MSFVDRSVLLERLDATIRAQAPIANVHFSDANPAGTAGITFAPEATSAQRAAANAALAAFDWSATADAAYLLALQRSTALADFLSDHSASSKVLRALAYVLLDQVNALNAAVQTLRNDARAVAPSIPTVTYPQYTVDDLAGAIQTKINAGTAD